MTFSREPYYITCGECNKEMLGIVDGRVREFCEPCGGNTTQYSASNPIPNGSTDQQRKRASA